MSTIKVNKIIPTGGVPDRWRGGIIQVVNTRVTATSSVSMNGKEFTNISVLNTSITPLFNTSKILVSMYMMGEVLIMTLTI